MVSTDGQAARTVEFRNGSLASVAVLFLMAIEVARHADRGATDWLIVAVAFVVAEAGALIGTSFRIGLANALSESDRSTTPLWKRLGIMFGLYLPVYYCLSKVSLFWPAMVYKVPGMILASGWAAVWVEYLCLRRSAGLEGGPPSA